MKIIIKNTKENIVALMRKIGYYPLEQKQASFIRPLEKSGYPRFHIYLKFDDSKNEIILNLHLDQKKPVYKGVPAHAGEYEGPVIEAEVQRIKKIIR